MVEGCIIVSRCVPSLLHRSCTCHMFADDKTVERRCSVCDLQAGVADHQASVDAIQVWCDQSGLSMNGDKCKFVVFGCPSLFKKPLPDLVLITAGHVTLRPVSDIKYLGVWLNQSLATGGSKCLAQWQKFIGFSGAFITLGVA